MLFWAFKLGAATPQRSKTDQVPGFTAGAAGTPGAAGTAGTAGTAGAAGAAAGAGAAAAAGAAVGAGGASELLTMVPPSTTVEPQPTQPLLTVVPST